MMNNQRIAWPVITLLIVFCVFASESARAEIEAPLTIVHPQSMPFYFETSSGEPRGILVDFWRLWAHKTGVEVRFWTVPWDSAISLLEDGRVDIAAGMAEVPGQDERIEYTQPFYETGIHLFFPEGVEPTSLEPWLKGKRIGVASSHGLNLLRRDRPDSVIVPYPNSESLVLAAISGEVDAFASILAVGTTYLAKNDAVGKFDPTQSAIHRVALRAAVKPGDAELLKLVRTGLAQISAAEVEDIVRVWTGAAGEGTPSRLFDRVIIAACKDQPPFDYVNEAGVPAGMFIDFWRLWAQKTKVKVEFLMGSWGETLAMVQDGRAQIHAGAYYSAARDRDYDFAIPLTTCDANFFFHESIFGLKNLQDLAGFKIGVIEDDYAQKYVEEQLPLAALAVYPTYKALFEAVEQGRIRVFLADTPTALHYLARKDLLYTYRYHADRPLYSKAIRPAVKEGQSALLSLVNRGIHLIKPDERAAIERRYAEAPGEHESDALVVALPAARAPFSLLNSEGEPAGMFVDIWKLWSEELGQPVRFFLTGPREAIAAVQSGRADIHGGLSKSRERSTSLTFSQPFYQVQAGVFSAGKFGEFPGLDALAGEHVGVMQGSPQEAYLRHHYPDLVLVEFSTPAQFVNAVADGRVRAGVAEFLPTLTLTKVLGRTSDMSHQNQPLYTSRVHAAVPQDNRDLLELVDKGFNMVGNARLSEIEARWVEDPGNRYYDKASGRVRLTGAESSWLERHKTVRFGGTPEWPPVDFQKDGDHAGMSADYLELLSHRLGAHFVNTPNLSWAEVLQGIKNKDLDLIACIMDTPDRRKYMLFTGPYLSFPIVLITRNDFPFVSGIQDLKGSSIAGVEDYAVTELAKRDYPNLDIREVPSVRDGLIRLSSGTVDSFLVGLPPASYLIEQLGMTNLKVAATSPYTAKLGFGVRKDWPQLVSILNKGIRSITPEEHREIYRKWVTIRFEHGIDTAYVWRVAGIVAGAAAVILLIGMLWHLQLKRREERFRGLTEYGTDVTQAFDINGTITYQSPSHKAILGYDKGELIGRCAFDYFHPDDLHRWREVQDQLLQGNRVQALQQHMRQKDLSRVLALWPSLLEVKTFQHRIRHKDGHYLLFESNCINLLGNKALQAIVINARDVTERQKMQVALELEKQRFQTLLEKAPFGIAVTSPTGAFVYTNERFVELLGYDATEIRDWANWITLAFPDEEYRRTVVDNWPRVEPDAGQDGDRAAEFTVRCKDGDDKVIRFKEVVVGAGEHLITCEDTTQLKHAQARLAEQLDRFRALYDLALEMTAERSLDENLELVVATAKNILNTDTSYIALADEQAAGVRMATCCGVRTEAFKNLVVPYGKGLGGQVARSKRGRIVRNYYEETDGVVDETVREEGVISGLASPVRIGDDNLGVLYVFNRTITEFGESDLDTLSLLANLAAVEITRKRFEFELGHAMEEANELRHEAESANRAKSSFLAKMSHELRTPLNAIIGYSEMLMEDAEDMGESDFVADLKKIRFAGKHLLELINDVLDLSKIEAGKMELYLETFMVGDLMDDVVSTIQPLVEKNGNVLEKQVDSSVGAIKADRTKVRQTLFNLLSNAAKFTENGAIDLVCGRSAKGDSDGVVFTVRDSGIGMTPQQLTTLFEAFVQADESISQKYGGTGLGLTITKRFTEMMGGEIHVTSEFGNGTEFTVWLPADVEAATSAAPREDRQHGKVSGDGEAPLILVVDDDAHTREITSRFLIREGYRVMEASRGEECLRMAGERRPDAILLDVLMPAMDGWAVLSELKSDPGLAGVPVIMLTVLEDQGIGYSLGAADYITKPVDQQQLVTVLRRLKSQASNLKALVVEDEESTRDMFRKILEREAWSVTVAVNGRVALEKIAQETPSLILLDLMMPEMDGFEFLDALREHEAWGSMTVLVVTAKDITAEERSKLNGHVESILQKGAQTRDELLGEIRRLVTRGLGRSEGAASESESVTDEAP